MSINRSSHRWTRAVVLSLLIGIARLPGFVFLDTTLPDGKFVMRLQLQTGGPTGVNWNQVAQDCLADWNTHLHGTTFSWENPSSADKQPQNKKNNVFWSKTVYGEALDPYVLGVTLAWTGTGDDTTVTETDTIFNTAASGGWASYDGPLRTKGATDFRRVAMHEFGHTLGLDHPDEHAQTVSALMNSTVSDVDRPTADDLAGIAYLYGPQAAPQITQQPKDLKDTKQVDLTAKITGRGLLWVTWTKDGKVVSGPTPINPIYGDTVQYHEDIYDPTPVANYALIAANPYGATRSRTAALVSSVISKGPKDVAVAQGGKATFTVVATSKSATYQWSLDDRDLRGATKASLTLNKVSPADAGTYQVRVKVGTKTAFGVAHLRLKTGVSVTAKSTRVSVGDPITLHAALSGAAAFDRPRSLAFDAAGNLYVNEHVLIPFTRDRLRKITPKGTVTTVYDESEFGPAMAFDATGNLYLQGGHSLLRAKAPLPSLPVVLAGARLENDDASVDGRRIFAAFGQINGVAVTPKGGVYVIDAASSGSRIRQVAADGRLKTLAGQFDHRAIQDGKGAKAAFFDLQAVTAAPDGALYVIDGDPWFVETGTAIRKITTSGQVTTLAGGAGAATQIDGPGAQARFSRPQAIAADRQGNLYVTDEGTVRKITPAGIVSTLAGNALLSGHRDGVGPDALLAADLPGIAVGADGAVHVSESENHVIRRIAPDGTVSTYAGRTDDVISHDGVASATYVWKHDGQVIPGAASETLTIPEASPDSAGSYAVTVRTVAGSAVSDPVAIELIPTFTAVPATQRLFDGDSITLAPAIANPTGHKLSYQWKHDGQIIAGADEPSLTLAPITSASEGDYTLTVSDGTDQVTSPPMTVTVPFRIAQPPQGGTFRDGSTVVLQAGIHDRLDPLFFTPQALVSDADGTLFVVEGENRDIRRITSDRMVQTVSGPFDEAPADPSGDRPTSLPYGRPNCIARDAAGNLYVGEAGAVRQVTPDGTVITLAGNPDIQGYADGAGSAAAFTEIAGIAVDASGRIYVAEAVPGGRIRQVSPTGAVATIASGFAAASAETTTLALGPDGDLFAFATDGACYRITAAGAVSIAAGAPGEHGLVDGPSALARFDRVDAICGDAAGNLYVLDVGNAAVRRIAPDGQVSTLAHGLPLQPGSSRSGLTVDSHGTLYVADASDHIISHLDADGTLRTVAGIPGVSGHRDGLMSRFQWQFNGQDIPGADGPSYLLPDLQSTAAGDYRLRIETSLGVLATAPATVIATRSTAWDLSFDPQTRTVAPGASVSFIIAARGTEPFSYQWTRNGTPIAGATTASFALDQVATSDAGAYGVTITNAVGSTNSPAAMVDVTTLATSAPALTYSNGGNGAISVGAGYDFSLTAPSDPGVAGALRYQWLKDGSAIAGATGPTLKLAHLALPDSAAYTVRITGDNGSLVSSACWLTVPPAEMPVISEQPADQSVVSGLAAQFQTSFQATSSLVTYQWARDGVPISGATRPTLSISPVSLADQGTYTLTATSDAGSVVSRAAFLTVLPGSPAITIDGQVHTAKEDQWSAAIPFTVSDPDTPASQLVVTARADSLIPDSFIDITGDGAARSLRFKGGLDVNGTTTLRLTVSDGTHTASAAIRVKITPINDPPVFRSIAPQTVTVGAAIIYTRFTCYDDYTSKPPKFSAVSSNTALIPNAGLTVTWDHGIGSIAINPVPGKTGTAVITVSCNDGQYTVKTRYAVTIVAANHAPTIAAIADQTMKEDSAAKSIRCSIADPETPAAWLQLRAQSSKTNLIAAEDIVLAGSGANRIVTIRPQPNANGVCRITLTVSDGVAQATRSFKVTIAASDDAPAISVIQDQSLDAGFPSAAIPFTVTDVDTSPSHVSVAARSADPDLIPTIPLRGSGTNRSIQLTPAPDRSGTTTVTLTASDGIKSASRTFKVTVGPAWPFALGSERRQVVVPGDPFALSLISSGGDAYTFQWYRNGKPIDGATSMSYAHLAATAGDAGYYWVDVSDSNHSHRYGPFFVLIAPPATRLTGWGDNFYHMLDFPADAGTPVALATTVRHALALQADGTVVGWGDDSVGQLDTPAGLHQVVAIGAGAWFSAALKADGSVVTWGNAPSVGNDPSITTGLVAISVGDGYILGLKLDGSVVGWGNVSFAHPVSIPASMPAVVALAAGSGYSLALRPDGTVFAWENDSSWVTSILSELGGITTIAAGSDGALALRSDGEVLSWGAYNSQLKPPVGLHDVTAISSGYYSSHALALERDGSVVAWGQNSSGEAQVPNGLSGVFAVAAGPGFSLALSDATPSSAPGFSLQPANQSVSAGSAVDFFVTTVGYPVPQVRWQISTDGGSSWADLADDARFIGTGSTVLSISPVDGALDGAEFRCVASNATAAEIRSDIATLTVGR
jgi:sugar lactone lactonase YvrE